MHTLSLHLLGVQENKQVWLCEQTSKRIPFVHAFNLGWAFINFLWAGQFSKPQQRKVSSVSYMSLKTGAQGEAKSVYFERCPNLFPAVNHCGQRILMCSGDNSTASSADLYLKIATLQDLCKIN